MRFNKILYTSTSSYPLLIYARGGVLSVLTDNGSWALYLDYSDIKKFSDFVVGDSNRIRLCYGDPSEDVRFIRKEHPKGGAISIFSKEFNFSISDEDLKRLFL